MKSSMGLGPFVNQMHGFLTGDPATRRSQTGKFVLRSTDGRCVLSSVAAVAGFNHRGRGALNRVRGIRMLVLFPGFIFTPRAVQGYHLTARIGGCGVWDFAVLGTVNPDVVNGDFHDLLSWSFQRNSMKSRNRWWVSISQLRCCARLYL